ncbi:2-oxoglutarate-dependent dioxygenase htyE-like [Gigantopelta aegis]|uniref:2-oxoglutarate-dependent dioxygenase htyE-like n=1 Tax=Gigantopelta aegis TaxID=1735272 RepID=UPI001B88E658|nr:2-oxoglutarate-dependent dioxygenase htyE-like [Gigantopelta aegis]
MIPTIDFSCDLLTPDSSCSNVTQSENEHTATQLIQAFNSVGFCYLVNHGVPSALVDDVFKTSRQFFDLPSDVKQTYARPTNSNHGWAALEREKLNPERPADLKESFNCQSVSQVWPLVVVPDMKSRFIEFLDSCSVLVFRILDLLAVGLKLEVDRHFFKKCHSQIGRSDGSSTLRSLFYPRLPSDGSIKPGQVRCGEHSDYGTLTLLFQDDIGGLQVQNTAGVYVDAKPLPGAVLVNIGDLLQRWTSNRLKATKHRVLIPEDEMKKGLSRQSIAFFIHPDDNFVIKCLDGSLTYEPTTNREYLKHKFALSY